MAKFSGVVGYGEQVEVRPGVTDKVITERSYFGDVSSNVRRLETGEKVNENVKADNTIEIVADAYANEHFFAIAYVEWAGTKWIVDSVEVRRPRLLLRLGGVYRGPTPA